MTAFLNSSAGAAGPGGVQLRCTALRQQVMQRAEPQLVPILVDVEPNDIRRQSPLPVNIAFVIDRSQSMEDDNKMEQVKQAIDVAIGLLHPQDFCSVTVFNDSAQVSSSVPRSGMAVGSARA